MNEYPFTHNQAEHRFELDLLDGTTALACYVVRADGAVILTHTEVPRATKVRASAASSWPERWLPCVPTAGGSFRNAVLRSPM